MIAGTIGVLFSLPGQTMGVGAFTDYLLDALKLNRDALAIAYMFGTAASSLLLTKAGKMWDKHGARIVLSAAAVTLSLFLLLGSFSPQVSTGIAKITGFQFSTVSFAVIMLVFFAIRFAGQGVLTLVSRNVTMKWFDQNRGLANGISSTFVSLGFSIAPLVLITMIHAFSWSGAWQIIAASLIVFMAFAIVFIRDNPEDCGLIPDGKIIPPKNKQETTFSTRKQYTLKEARKTWTFWIYTLTLAFYSLYVTGLTFNIESIFENSGYDSTTAFQIFFPIAIISIAISVFGNIISDYIKLQYLLFVMILGALCSTVATIHLETGFGIPLLIAGNGIMGGIFVILMAVAWPRFFGRKHLGAISGFSSAILQFASAIGPILFSRAYTQTGSYDLAGWISLVYVAILTALAFKATNPQQGVTQ